MKRWKWIGLFSVLILSGGVGILWILRLRVLPFLIYLVGQRYEIDRVKYEAAEWSTLREIAFYHLSVEKNHWMLIADTLRVLLFPSLSIRIKNGEVAQKESSSAYSTPSSAPRSFSAFGNFRKLIRLVSRIDTIVCDHLLLPKGIRLTLNKFGKLCTAQVRRDTFQVLLHSTIGEDSLSFQIPPGRISLNGENFLSWDSLTGHLTVSPESLSADLQAEGVQVFHHRLASRKLSYAQVGFHLKSIVHADSFLVELMPRALPLQGILAVGGQLSGNRAWLKLDIPRQPHQAYLQAFPQGFFTCLDKAKLGGSSSLSLKLVYDPSLPDTLALEVDWQPEGFVIYAWEGVRTPLTLRESFSYSPPGSTRTILVSPDQPNFLVFSQITPYVLHAVLHSEDGVFFSHQGFQKAHFLKAMLENWHCRCFRRGAGTITMQLVRNLLLSREKTLARKVEEILLTAIIERFHLLSKQRIAELYLNIIEWGPDVYGLVEASRFYFGKEPHDLTIPEAIFLGMLLPNPKTYRFFIDKETGCVLSAYKPHFQKIAYFLVRQNYLPPDSMATILPERVCLRPPAWSFPDTLRP
ncbi:MAG: transglycosylase domain-containing protein [Bacteroidia bacterium]|nr:transglycosylase domain-containing protein [Bacteroidia bacterium]